MPQSSQFKGLYINDYDTIIGNSAEKNSLVSFYNYFGFNSLYFYDLTTVLSSSSGRTNVRDFNTLIRTSGITNVGGIGGSSTTLVGSGTTGNNSRYYFNTGCTVSAQTFNVFNLENEFWNYPDNVGTVSFADYSNQLLSISAVTSGNSITFDAYIGLIRDNTSTYTQSQISTILVNRLDRILLSCYVTTSQFTGSTNYGFTTVDEELELLGTAASGSNKTIDVIIIFHGGTSYMHSYFAQYGFQNAYSQFSSSFNSWASPSKNYINLIGYMIYGYQQVKDIPFIVLPTLTPTPTITKTPAQSPPPTSTPTNTNTPTKSPTKSRTPTPTRTPTVTPTISKTAASTPPPTNSATPTKTKTPTKTPAVTPPPTNTSTPSNTPTKTKTSTPTLTKTPATTPPPTNTPSNSPTKSNTPTPSITKTQTFTPSISPSKSLTPTNTPTKTKTPTPTKTPTISKTAAVTPPPTNTATTTKTKTPTVTSTTTLTKTPAESPPPQN